MKLFIRVDSVNGSIDAASITYTQLYKLMTGIKASFLYTQHCSRSVDVNLATIRITRMYKAVHFYLGIKKICG